MKNVIFCFIIFFNINIWAHDSTEEPVRTNKEKKFQRHSLTINLGMNFITDKNGAKLSLMFGEKYSFYFTPKTGVFFGFDYIQRSFEQSGYENRSFVKKVNFVDIPFGFVFKRGDIRYPSAAIFIGSFYALPQGDKVLEKSKQRYLYRYSERLKNSLGFFLHFENYFRINESFDLGFFLSMKIGGGATKLEFLPDEPVPFPNDSDELEKASTTRGPVSKPEGSPGKLDIAFGFLVRF